MSPASCPTCPVVREFEAHIAFKAPRARVAALCFDKIDVETGVATPRPDGKLRKLRYPWGVLAWQLAGSDGLRLIHADDGALHYAVLGPRAASDPGKPSAEARKFIEQTTTPDGPRVYRNAVVLAVPSRDGLEAARTRVRDYLGWEEVRAQLLNQPIDPLREQMLAAETAAARKRVPDAVRSAYCMVVTVSDSDAIHAFRVVVGDEPPFTTIKADRRSRIQETAISAEAMLPAGRATCGARTSKRGGSNTWWAPSRSSETAQDAAHPGDLRYRAGWRSQRNLGCSACASRSNDQNILAIRHRRAGAR